MIAENSAPGEHFIRIVVTDEAGRFVLPELEHARYRVWSRGYGLLDSVPVEVSTGETVTLKADIAPTESEAARIYPANYWTSLLQVPDEKSFPGSGPAGNGIPVAMESRQQWTAQLIENCRICHQLGTRRIREFTPDDHPEMAWQQRIQKNRGPDDIFFAGDESYLKRNFAGRMAGMMSLLGWNTGIRTFSDWTDRIGNGEVPPAPPRPVGIERNLVVTLLGMGEGRFLHDTVSTDKRDPTINPNGPVYGTATYSGMVYSLDPESGRQRGYELSDFEGNYFKSGFPHTPTMDAKGRIWTANITHLGTGRARLGGIAETPAYCSDPKHPYAKYFPRTAEETWTASVYDPDSGTDQPLPLCFGTHHLNLDDNDRLYLSGDTEVVGWLDVDVWDETGKVEEAIGWCPFVLDTNGDGKITPDHTSWNQWLEGIEGGEGAGLKAEENTTAKADLDPTRDTRMAGFNYGMGVSPVDQSYWAAKFSPYVPSGILRVDPGKNPPETCKTEYYEPPKTGDGYKAFNARGVDVDESGIAWVAFGSGAIGRFDRSKCETLNGPEATGQHCEEGWDIIETPGPRLKGTKTGTDWFYLVFIDHHNTLGLGKGIPVFPNSVGDELLAYLPDKEQFVHLRVPYPLGFYPRSVDGRIDNSNTGWKGRGLWSGNHVIPLWHQETGEGSTGYAAHFQLRPHPLAK